MNHLIKQAVCNTSTVFTIMSGVIDCMLWAELDDETPLDQNHSVSDISDELAESLHKMCVDFLELSGEACIQEAADSQQYGMEHVGHDLWLTTRGHGAGFWDGDYTKELGEKLTKICEGMKAIDVYVGDDAKIYGM